MANTFKNSKLACTTSLTDVYTCPSSNVNGTVSAAVVLMIQASNINNRADTLTLVWTDSSGGNVATRLCFQTPIPAQQSIGCLTGKLVLEPGDKIRAQCGTSTMIELTVSVLETT
jgi:hypothetical protein